MKQTCKTALLGLAVSALPATAIAHVGAADMHGFGHGFTHPIGGIDHILAMVAVGLLAAHLGGRALWLVPATFVVTMAAGGLFGIAGIAVPLVEIGIAASVIVLGLAVAMQRTMPTIAAIGMAGFFAIFHGYAHGAEMPAGASGLDYAVGFMVATATLHLAGIGIGFGIARIGARAALQAGGGVIALAGFGILTGQI